MRLKRDCESHLYGLDKICLSELKCFCTHLHVSYAPFSGIPEQNPNIPEGTLLKLSKQTVDEIIFHWVHRLTSKIIKANNSAPIAKFNPAPIAKFRHCKQKDQFFKEIQQRREILIPITKRLLWKWKASHSISG